MIIDNIGAAGGGLHCETSALGVLLRHEGIDLSEPMLFGLGEGLGFIYWDMKTMAFPFIGGRSKPFAIVKTLAGRLGLRLHVNETASVRKAWQDIAAPLEDGRPVGLQLDSYHLDYFSTKIHFGGHFVAMYGYDDTYAYLIDTAQQGGAVTTTLKSLELARGERGPMTARNLSFTVAGKLDHRRMREFITASIRNNAHDFLNPPIGNFGYRGIEKAAMQVRKWLERSADPEHDLATAASLMERAGTGGALFRRIYRDFLAECRSHVDDRNLRLGHDMYRDIAPLWTEVAAHIAAARLDDAAAILRQLAERERTAMETLANVAG